MTVGLNVLHVGCQVVPSSHPESTSSTDSDLPPLDKFLTGPSAHGKLSSRLSKVANLRESDGDSEELEIVSRPSSTGPYSLVFSFALHYAVAFFWL